MAAPEAPPGWPLRLVRSEAAGFALLLLALLGLATGLTAWHLGRDAAASAAFSLATSIVLLALLVEIAGSLAEGRFGLDIVAALSMSAALAFGEPLAGNVVALMYAGGQQLERYAEGRARRDMTGLLARAARTAMRYEDGGLAEVPVAAVVPGDRLLVRHGDVVPVDGRVLAPALLDMSPITGEAEPVRRRAGEEALSGSTCVGPAFELIAARTAAESTYAGIVRLVEEAARSRAPMVRLADRYALVFLFVTLALAGGAALLSGDPRRALAVLVVATPCPLILAVPVALVAGLSRAAKLGVLVKSGRALEAMADVRVLVIDKTGTLTHGSARLKEVRAAPPFAPEEVLRFAASLDQASSHVVAQALVAHARAEGITLAMPRAVEEAAGTGIAGEVEGRAVVVGGGGFVAGRCAGDLAGLREGLTDGMGLVAVGIDGKVAGLIALADEVRDDAMAMLGALRGAGVNRIVLASGDRAESVERVGRGLSLDHWRSGLDPAGKVEIVHASREDGPVMMVGDGVNDAPALAAADIGVAMGARGAAASSEAADAVLLVDRLDRLAQVVALARRTRRIALESVVAGIGLSALAMVAAALGYLPPVQGALIQEAIDVAVILNALRVLRPS